jgi:hypothetical protein
MSPSSFPGSRKYREILIALLFPIPAGSLAPDSRTTRAFREEPHPPLGGRVRVSVEPRISWLLLMDIGGT